MLHESVGLVKLASVVSVDTLKNTMEVRIESFAAGSNSGKATIPLSQPYSSNNGILIGSIPSPGSTIVIQQGSGGQWFFSSFFNRSFDNSNLDSESFTIQSDANTFLKVNKKNQIVLGEKRKNITIQTSPNNNFYNAYFDNINVFTEGTRNITGVIKRDLKPNTNVPDSLKLHDVLYDNFLKPIGFDNTLSPNKYKNTTLKNPPLIESRFLITEFPESSSILDDLAESDNYGVENIKPLNYKSPNRRLNKTDTLGLSLTNPNYLIESVKGTVVDYFGNILDLNRYPLPIGQGKFTIKSEDDSKTDSKKDKYLNLRALHRRGLAYHFELNARKDFLIDGQLKVPSINDNYDYSRTRSRFFINIDKEGQFKVNIPASSESGNIPLLTRYESFSYISDEDSGNPNKVIKRDDNLDILHDSFAADSYDIFSDEADKIKGCINIEYTDNKVNIVDRITKNVIKHGTAYHDISNILYSFKKADFYDIQLHPDKIIDTTNFLFTGEFVSKTITVGKNAGGRSGQFSTDGFIELNIGANTIDRQSLWADLAGGIVAQVGRDRNNNSFVGSFDGDMLIQIGGFGITSDGRFQELNNTFRGGKIDIRVLNSGFQETIVRIENGGVTIMTPGELKLYSAGDMQIKSDATMSLLAEELYIQDRLMNKGTDQGSS